MNQAATTQGGLRMFSVMRYANETDNVGRQNAGKWSQVESLLRNREIRVQKTGKAFAPVKLKPGATRARNNVEAISMAWPTSIQRASRTRQRGVSNQ